MNIYDSWDSLFKWRWKQKVGVKGYLEIGKITGISQWIGCQGKGSEAITVAPSFGLM